MTDEQSESDLKKKVESVLFSAGTKVAFDEICKLVKEKDHDKVLHALEELRADYDQRNTSLQVFQDGDKWKLTVRESFLPIVRRIVTQTELPKSVMETLAVVASKAPVLQSRIISIRTNKAYEHLAELEQAGYITRAKHGRTKMVKLAEKFFHYFDVPENQLRDRFGRVKELEQAVAEKEAALEQRHTEIKAQHDAARQQDVVHKQHTATEHERLDTELATLPSIRLVDEQGHATDLEVFDEPASTEPAEDTVPGAPSVGPVTGELGGLEVVDIPTKGARKTKPHKRKHKQKPTIHTDTTTTTQHPAETRTPTGHPEQHIAQPEPTHDRTWEGKGVFPEGVPPDVAQKIDERVNEIVHGKTGAESEQADSRSTEAERLEPGSHAEHISETEQDMPEPPHSAEKTESDGSDTHPQ